MVHHTTQYCIYLFIYFFTVFRFQIRYNDVPRVIPEVTTILIVVPKTAATGRQRVAINQEEERSSPCPPYLSFSCRPWLLLVCTITGSDNSTLHPPAEYAALVANAAEFQRRNNQSTQDRRRCCSTLPLVNL